MELDLELLIDLGASDIFLIDKYIWEKMQHFMHFRIYKDFPQSVYIHT